MLPRRFPPPWSGEVTPNRFIVREANGQALSYVYNESEPGDDRLPSFSVKMKRGGLLRTSRSCRSFCCARPDTHFALKYRHARQQAAR
jgi:hypothetical protein